MIWSFQPFSTKNDIGEYNRHCERVPNSKDWILIKDYDCMILCPESFNVIDKAIERYQETAIFGAMTNRIAYSHQRLLPQMDENDSIRHHTQIAMDLAEKYKDGECEDCKNIAGFFMLFRKEYWEKSPFQSTIYDDKKNLFDRNFTMYAKLNKLPMRIIKGCYLFHSYRIMKESYKDTSHLKCHEKS